MGRQRGGAKHRKRKLRQSASEDLNPDPDAPIHPKRHLPETTPSLRSASEALSSSSQEGNALKEPEVEVEGGEAQEMADVDLPDPDHGASAKRSKHAVLTPEEADHLRETSNLFRSNLLKLEIEQLLVEVEVRYDSSKMARMGQLVAALTGHLQQMQSSEHLLDGEGFQGLWRWPVKPLAKPAFSFHKPEEVTVVGSFASETMAKPMKEVDLAILLPSACFEPRDFLNYRYHDKRLAYLLVLGRKLAMRKSMVKDVRLEAMLADPNKTVLRLTPADSHRLRGYTIRLLPYVSDQTFPLKKLKPSSSKLDYASI